MAGSRGTQRERQQHLTLAGLRSCEKVTEGVFRRTPGRKHICTELQRVELYSSSLVFMKRGFTLTDENVGELA